MGVSALFVLILGPVSVAPAPPALIRRRLLALSTANDSRSSVNIGNARLYSLEEDLNMSGNQYQIAVSVLFPTYVLFELPSNLVLKHYVRPSRWIAFITTCWGLIATLSGLTQSYAGLIACRVLLGLFEAGLFPGCVVSLISDLLAHQHSTEDMQSDASPDRGCLCPQLHHGTPLCIESVGGVTEGPSPSVVESC